MVDFKTVGAKKLIRKIKEYVPAASLIIFAVTLVAVVLFVLFLFFPSFADAFNRTVSAAFRLALAKLTALFPTSLGEYVILSLPVTLFLVLRGLFRYMDSHPHGFARSLTALLSAVGVLFSLFVFDFAAGYHGSTLDKKLSIERQDISVSQLKDTALYITEKLNALAPDVQFTSSGSTRGYSHSDTVALAYESYEALSERYSFLKNFKAPVKRLAVSNIMTYTHISGIYSYFTGEANLNTNYPEFVNVFTIAHEMAHQRGVARENEANFIAYLVCIGSDDVYMQYAGYLNMLEYLTSAIAEDSVDDMAEVYRVLDSRVYNDLVEYGSFFVKYSDSTASKVTEAVNDTYLILQGTEGTRSYGMVVDLAVAYHIKDIEAAR